MSLRSVAFALVVVGCCPAYAAETAFKDGTYKGKQVDAYYGWMQVGAVISGGRLVDIQILDYPRDRSRSKTISQQSLPILTKEAISIQSAEVHVVSGATPTSRAFSESLAAALRAAH